MTDTDTARTATSDYLERPLRSLADVLAERAAAIAPRDLLDLAATAGEIELYLRWAREALYAAFEDGDPVAPVLHDLRQARGKLDALIAELDEPAKGRAA